MSSEPAGDEAELPELRSHDREAWSSKARQRFRQTVLSVHTDPGTGITHPGWHGLTPPGCPKTSGPSEEPRDPPTWEEIAAQLMGEYSNVFGTGAAPLAHQIACIAQISCQHQNDWAKGFVTDVFKGIYNNRRSPFRVLQPNIISSSGEATLSNYTRLAGVPGVLTNNDVCAVIGGFGHHFPCELLPSFAKHCGELRRRCSQPLLYDARAPMFRSGLCCGRVVS